MKEHSMNSYRGAAVTGNWKQRNDEANSSRGGGGRRKKKRRKRFGPQQEEEKRKTFTRLTVAKDKAEQGAGYIEDLFTLTTQSQSPFHKHSESWWTQ